jgi:hypothetical protein
MPDSATALQVGTILQGVGVTTSKHHNLGVAYLIVEDDRPGVAAAIQRLEPLARLMPD